MSRRTANLLLIGLLLILELVWSANTQAVHAAPAPALRYLQVTHVRSQRTSWEPIPASQFSTVNDHGGNWLQVQTAELGYGSNPIAMFNGQRMTRVASSPILNSSRIVEGWYYVWQINTNVTSGTFTYQNTSTNSPWNTMSDRVFIK